MTERKVDWTAKIRKPQHLSWDYRKTSNLWKQQQMAASCALKLTKASNYQAFPWNFSCISKPNILSADHQTSPISIYFPPLEIQFCRWGGFGKEKKLLCRVKKEKRRRTRVCFSTYWIQLIVCRNPFFDEKVGLRYMRRCCRLHSLFPEGTKHALETEPSGIKKKRVKNKLINNWP